jgi:hypothetical protein
MTDNPHPMSRCPYCGCSKAVVTWRACSRYCDDHMQAVDRKFWKAPLVTEGTEEPELEYSSQGHQRTNP